MFRSFNGRLKPLERASFFPQFQWSSLHTVEITPFQLTSDLMRFPSLTVISSSPFHANKLRSLAFGTPHWGDASFVCPHDCNGNHARKVMDALNLAHIPEGRSLDDFDWSLYGVDLTKEKLIVDRFIERFPEFEQNGLGLFLTSKMRGSGKTFLAYVIGRELINRFEASVRFVSASDLINISKERRDDGRDSLNDLISRRILILDDLGQQRTGRDWQTDIPYRIIDERYRSKKVIIVTSNVALPELDFDDRIVDRLNAMTVTVKLPEVCIRAREANSRKISFLKNLGITL